MNESDPKQQLLTALHRRGIDLGPDDVSWAFESDQTRDDTIAWVRDYLSNSTLLTRDELMLYEAIEKQGVVLSTQSTTIPLQEYDIKAAIESLKASTAVVDKHTRALEAQKEALAALKCQKSTINGSSSFSQRYAQESGQLVFAIDDLLHSTKEQLSEAEQHSQHAMSSVKSLVTERLTSDDQVLEALSKLASKIPDMKGPSIDLGTVEKWCRALASLRELEVKAKVDLILQGVDILDGQASKEEDSETEELRGELQTLREEIGSVVQMVIGHEIRDPLLRDLQISETNSRKARRNWSQYLVYTLNYLIAQLETMRESVANLRCYDSALCDLRSLLTAAEAGAVGQPDPSNTTTATSISATGANNKSRLSGDRSAASNTINQALRRFDPTLTEAVDSKDAIETLDTVTSEATSRLRSQYSAAVVAAVESLSKSLSEKQQDSQSITEKIFANSQYNTIRLSDRDLDSRLHRLNKSVDELAPAVAKADPR